MKDELECEFQRNPVKPLVVNERIMAEEKKKTTKKKESTESKGVKETKAKTAKKPKKAEELQEKPVLDKNYVPRLKTQYFERIVPELQKKFNYRNVMLTPKLVKITLNIGSGTLHQDQKYAESLIEELGIITGQKAVLSKARKSISNFKLRQGMTVGCRVTLRGYRMFEFLDRLITVSIPRIRDFRGLSDKSFDGRGNYNFGIKEHIVFAEIDYDKVVKIHGMDICISTTARTDEEAYELLKGFGFPFKRRTGTEDSEIQAA